MRGESSMISSGGDLTAAAEGISRWEMMALRSQRELQIDLRMSLHRESLMMRSMDWLALFECKVPRQRWPVSANVMAASMVSVSRISPMRITSGPAVGVFERVAERIGVETDFTLSHDRLFVMMDELDRVFRTDDVLRAPLVP